MYYKSKLLMADVSENKNNDDVPSDGTNDVDSVGFNEDILEGDLDFDGTLEG